MIWELAIIPRTIFEDISRTTERVLSSDPNGSHVTKKVNLTADPEKALTGVANYWFSCLYLVACSSAEVSIAYSTQD